MYYLSFNNLKESRLSFTTIFGFFVGLTFAITVLDFILFDPLPIEFDACILLFFKSFSGDFLIIPFRLPILELKTEDFFKSLMPSAD